MADGLDLSTVQIHNSPDVRTWPATASITKLVFGEQVHVEHTKNQGAADGSDGSWPNFEPIGPDWAGGGEGLQYTLWLIEKINGQWHGAGGIQFWRSCAGNGGPPEGFCRNWWNGAVDRWGPMATYQPRPGELVGFMVTAGDARGNGVQTVHERSEVVVIPFPRSGDSYTAPSEAQPPAPIPPPTPAPAPDDPANPLAVKLGQLLDLYNELKDQNQEIRNRIGTLEGNRGAVPPVAWRGQLKVPYIGGLSFVADTPMTAAQLAAYKAGK